jgi:hypothetical protein
LFDRQFDDYLSKTRKAYEYLIKSLLVTLPWADRRALEHGEVRIHSLRDPTRHIEAHLETAENILPLRARMGFVLQVTYQGLVTLLRMPAARRHHSPTYRSGWHPNGRSVIATTAAETWTHQGQSITRIVARRLPFDREAHWNGSTPAPTPNASPSSNHWASPSRFR